MAWGNKGSEGGVPATGGALSFIGGEVSITGNVSGQGDLHLDGAVDGDVSCKSLILGPTGRIKGNVAAERATIGGSVEGTISAVTLIVEKSARVSGDLVYQSVSVENGAQVDGRLTLRNTPPKELKLVAAGE
jgi:cytoskeletal protein CcmA (bactofilin family)